MFIIKLQKLSQWSCQNMSNALSQSCSQTYFYRLIVKKIFYVTMFLIQIVTDFIVEKFPV